MTSNIYLNIILSTSLILVPFIRIFMKDLIFYVPECPYVYIACDTFLLTPQIDSRIHPPCDCNPVTVFKACKTRDTRNGSSRTSQS